MSRSIETRHIEYNQIYKCECRLDASVCNNRQRCNEDKCRCECKELVDKGSCDKGVIWGPSKCDCDCDNLCGIREHLDYENCWCRIKLVDNVVECNSCII